MTTRGNFLAAASLLAALPRAAGAAMPPPASSKSPAEVILTFAFDRAAFDAVLRRPAEHKQSFGAVRLEGGVVMGSMRNSIEAYDDFLREGKGSMHVVGVLYHSSAPLLAMNDTVWNDVLIPYLKSNTFWSKQWRSEVPEAKPGQGNPYLKKPELRQLIDDMGASFFVCHNVIAGFANDAAKALGETPQAVHATIMANIVPGAIAVPAGVMAVNACQEAGFTYIQSSV